jgi:hypothetical protein
MLILSILCLKALDIAPRSRELGGKLFPVAKAVGVGLEVKAGAVKVLAVKVWNIDPAQLGVKLRGMYHSDPRLQ